MADSGRRPLGLEMPREQLNLETIRRLIDNLLVTPEGCWEWQGYLSPKGYGQIKLAGRAHWVHRVAYAVFNGSLPAGKDVDHTCNRCSCCNPEHLRLMDRTENTARGNRYRNGHEPPPF